MYFCARICVREGSRLRLGVRSVVGIDKEGADTPILAAMSDVAGVPGGDISHSSSTSLPSEVRREGGGGEEYVNVARVYNRSQS